MIKFNFDSRMNLTLPGSFLFADAAVELFSNSQEFVVLPPKEFNATYTAERTVENDLEVVEIAARVGFSGHELVELYGDISFTNIPSGTVFVFNDDFLVIGIDIPSKPTNLNEFDELLSHTVFSSPAMSIYGNGTDFCIALINLIIDDGTLYKKFGLYADSAELFYMGGYGIVSSIASLLRPWRTEILKQGKVGLDCALSVIWYLMMDQFPEAGHHLISSKKPDIALLKRLLEVI